MSSEQKATATIAQTLLGQFFGDPDLEPHTEESTEVLQLQTEESARTAWKKVELLLSSLRSL